MIGQSQGGGSVTQVLESIAIDESVSELREKVTKSLLLLLHNKNERVTYIKRVTEMLNQRTAASNDLANVISVMVRYAESNPNEEFLSVLRPLTDLANPSDYLIEKSRELHVARETTAQFIKEKRECLKASTSSATETVSMTGEMSLVPILQRINENGERLHIHDVPVPLRTSEQIFVQFSDQGRAVHGGIVINAGATMTEHLDGQFNFGTLHSVKTNVPSVKLNILGFIDANQIQFGKHALSRFTEHGVNEEIVRDRFKTFVGDNQKEWIFENVCTLTEPSKRNRPNSKLMISFTCSQVVISLNDNLGGVSKNKSIKLVIAFTGVSNKDGVSITNATIEEDLSSFLTQTSRGSVFVITSINESTGTEVGQIYHSGFPRMYDANIKRGVTTTSLAVHGGDDDIQMAKHLNELVENTDARQMNIKLRDTVLSRMLANQGISIPQDATHVDLTTYFQNDNAYDEEKLNLNSGYLVSFKLIEAIQRSNSTVFGTIFFMMLKSVFMTQFRIDDDINFSKALDLIFTNTCSRGEHEHFSICISKQDAHLYRNKPGVSVITPIECLQRILTSAIMYVEAQSSAEMTVGPALTLTSSTYTRMMATPICTSQMLYYYDKDALDDKKLVAEPHPTVIIYTPTPSMWAMFNNIKLHNTGGRFNVAKREWEQGKNGTRLLTVGMQKLPRAFAAVTSALVPTDKGVQVGGTDSDIRKSVKIRIGNDTYSCDYLICDIVRAIRNAVNNANNERDVRERTFIYSSAVLALLIVMPDDINDKFVRPQVYINPAPRPTRYVKPFKNISDSYLTSKVDNVKAYQQIHREHNYYVSFLVAKESAY